MSRSRWAMAAVAAVAAGAACLAVLVILDDDDSTAEDTADRLDLVVVGDSFVEHSRDQIHAYADSRGLSNEVMGLGGTAICNWEDKLQAYAEQAPEVMVLSFAGNDIPNSCFNPTDDSRDAATVAAAYRTELDEVIELFADSGSRLYAVLPPPIRDARFEERAAAMRAMYVEAAEDHPELRLISSAPLLDPDGEGFVAVMPCAAWDDCPPSGEVTVREDDGIHLTPAGAERYARAILFAVG